MSQTDKVCLYDKNHMIPIYDKSKEMEERNLNITVLNTNDVLLLKLRDPLDYCFNYTENIDLGDFEVMRLNQNLDINFSEFRYNLIEMLQQFQKKEMFLKCEISNQKCTLIFYCKSKIKSIVYLTIDLHITNQKEIFSELVNTMQNIQDTNERQKKQISHLKKTVSEKDQEIHTLNTTLIKLQGYLYNNLIQIEKLFNNKILEMETLLANRIKLTMQKLSNVSTTFDLLKRETTRTNDSNRKLIESMEHLKADVDRNLALVNHLQKENSALHTAKFNQEKYNSDLQKTLHEKDSIVANLKKKNNELQSDMEKITILMAQKKSMIDELSKDLVQANQMLVNFNNHYDSKCKQVEELQAALVAKETALKEQKLKTQELLNEHENYKIAFNKEEREKLKYELLLANNKIEELDKALRKTNKINALLTDKVNHPKFNPQ